MNSIYVNWGDAKVKLTWKRDLKLPPRNLVTSAHGFCFLEGKLLLVKLNHRGWDFPGGHMEEAETEEECFKREALEEGYVEGQCSLLGHIIVDHSENSQWNKDSKYPKVGYQVFYRMDIKEVLNFDPHYESSERIFMNPENIEDFYQEWHELYAEILNCAFNTIKGDGNEYSKTKQQCLG